MFLKAGALSLALLLLSRVLGLVRESVLAATFGASGLGDVAVLMLTLPDWGAGVLAGGALAYVLLPHWAKQTPAQQAATQRTVAIWLLVGGLGLGLGLVLCRAVLTSWLAAGVPTPLQPEAQAGLVWAAVSLPAALLASLGVTRLQHERDFTGMYGANLVVNGVVIGALLLMAWLAVPQATAGRVTELGLALCAAMGLRLLWLHWRARQPLRPGAELGLAPDHADADAAKAMPGPVHQTHSAADLPPAALWVWAALAAGLPLTLPFAARSLASGEGEGALATFNYAWKLVELPLMLAIQLVASLAFPALTRAMLPLNGAEQGQVQAALTLEARQLVRSALALAWTLACAATLALQVGGRAITELLFGWGRMDADALARVADWGRVGAWGLLPQALIAVAVTVLAAQSRLRAAVAAYAGALAILLLCGGQGMSGQQLMGLLNLLLGGVALLLLWAMLQRGPAAGADVARPSGWAGVTSVLCWPAMLAPLALLLAGTVAVHRLGAGILQQKGISALVLSALSAIGVIAITALLSPALRRALRR